jgi:hypothetical protein
MMTAAFYKEMTPADQLGYRKTVKVYQWPTDKRASKALMMVVLASMMRPAQGSIGLGAAANATARVAQAFSWAYIAHEAGRWLDFLSGYFVQGAAVSIIFSHIILQFYRTHKNSQNKAANRANRAANRTNRAANRAALLQMALQLAPHPGAHVLPAGANRLALPAPARRLPLQAPARPRSSSNANLLAAMPNRPLAHARRSPVARANR